MQVYVPTVKVIVELLYRITPEDISVMIDTKLKIAPDRIPLDIIGIVIFVNADTFGAPRLSAASSTLIGIFIMAAVAERLVKGIRRIASAMIIIARVPVMENGFLENAITSEIPITAPGIMYGIIETVSMALFAKLFFLTTR